MEKQTVWQSQVLDFQGLFYIGSIISPQLKLLEFLTLLFLLQSLILYKYFHEVGEFWEVIYAPCLLVYDENENSVQSGLPV
jgi:hypothetical protein